MFLIDVYMAIFIIFYPCVLSGFVGLLLCAGFEVLAHYSHGQCRLEKSPVRDLSGAILTRIGTEDRTARELPSGRLTVCDIENGHV